MGATKIATCCYCGTRAVLVLRGKVRQELACSNCGAPLHALKMLPRQPEQATTSAMPHNRPPKRARKQKYRDDRPWRPAKRKKSGTFGRRVMSKIWDAVEDVVDDIFD